MTFKEGCGQKNIFYVPQSKKKVILVFEGMETMPFFFFFFFNANYAFNYRM